MQSELAASTQRLKLMDIFAYVYIFKHSSNVVAQLTKMCRPVGCRPVVCRPVDLLNNVSLINPFMTSIVKAEEHFSVCPSLCQSPAVLCRKGGTYRQTFFSQPCRNIILLYRIILRFKIPMVIPSAGVR